MILHVDVVNKIATFQKRGGCIVCGNSDYKIKFSFDREWDAHKEKTARFIYNGQFTDVDFTGDLCPVPIIYDTPEVEVGVYASELKTTTSAFIGCYRSILCEVATPSEENNRLHINEAKEAADRAEKAAKEAEEAAGKVIIEGGGISAEVERRLSALENDTATRFTTDKTLTLNTDNVLSVNMSTAKDRSLPIKASDVDVIVGNIDVLLKTI